MLSGAAALGLVIGSFLNVVIYRLPAGKSVVTPRSRCPHCGRPIPWYENLPVLSFLWLRAKCRGCRAPISWRYPLVEALTGGLFFGATWLLLFPGHRDWTTNPDYWVHLAAAFAFLGAMVALTFIDIDHRILPDRITKPGMAAGALFSLLCPRLLQPDLDAIPSLPDPGKALVLSVGGMVVGYGSLWLVGWLGEKAFRKEAMGLGDAKLLAMVGAFTGPKGALVAMALGFLLGLGVGLVQQWRSGDSLSPFGPSLAVGGAAVFLAPRSSVELLRRVVLLTSDPWGGVGLAALFAGLVLLYRTRYPRGLFLTLLALVAVLAFASLLRLYAAPP